MLRPSFVSIVAIAVISTLACQSASVPPTSKSIFAGLTGSDLRAYIAACESVVRTTNDNPEVLAALFSDCESRDRYVFVAMRTLIQLRKQREIVVDHEKLRGMANFGFAHPHGAARIWSIRLCAAFDLRDEDIVDRIRLLARNDRERDIRAEARNSLTRMGINWRD